MKSNALFAIAEGLVGSFQYGALYPQSMNVFLQSLKLVVINAGRFVEDDHLVSYFSDPDESEDIVQEAVTYVYGFMVNSAETNAVAIQLWDVATPTPGGTTTGQAGTLLLPAASSTAKAQGGVLWFPYEKFGTTCLISSVRQSDYATGAGTGLTPAWVFWRNE